MLTGSIMGILGAVLFGIGIALMIERYGAPKNIRGWVLEVQ